MRRIVFVVVLGCHPAPPQPKPEPADLTLEAAAACGKAPHFSLELITATAWKIRTDAGEHVIDAQKRTCDDAAIEFPTGTAVIDLLATAAKCVQGPPWNGEGTSHSPLDLQHPVIHRGDILRIEYGETEPRTKPSGAELGARRRQVLAVAA